MPLTARPYAMKSCGYCGGENADDATYCFECGMELAASTAQGGARESEPARGVERVELVPDVPPDGEAALCTTCLFPNLPEAQWCKRCGAPLNPIVWLLMPDAAIATGFAYRQAVESPSKLVVVGGIWLHFLPGLVVSIFVFLNLLAVGPNGLQDLVSFSIVIGAGFVCASMIYRVTRNYYRLRSGPSHEPAG